jgi:drug/metabolite transporter, DME family
VSRKPAPLGASLLTVSAALVWSLGSLTNRWTHGSDAWQYLLWRSIGIIVVLEVLARVKRRPSPLVSAWTSGWLMVLASFGLLGASVGFVYAIKNTTAANAAFFSSLSPFVVAIFGFLVLKERVNRSTMFAMTLAAIGLLVMAFGPDGGAKGNGLAPTLHGNLSGLACSVGFAVWVICMRAEPDVDWTPVMPGYCSLLIPLSIIVSTANRRSLVPPAGDISKAVFHGAVLIVLGTYLFNRSAKQVPAVAMTVFSQVETISVPILIFLAFHEVPGVTSIIGGALILAAVVVQAIGQSRVGPGGVRDARDAPGSSVPIPG